MPRQHYHVGQNTAGYLPESDVEQYTTKREAEDALRWHRDQWHDLIWEHNETCDPDDRMVMTGSIRSGHLWIDEPNDPYHIPTHLWIEPCQDDCTPEEEW